jgi:hypothetical protein
MLTEEQKEDLFEFLDTECAIAFCDHTHKLTRQWIKENDLEDMEEEIIEYLEENGGYCDCEVVFNVLDR